MKAFSLYQLKARFAFVQLWVAYDSWNAAKKGDTWDLMMRDFTLQTGMKMSGPTYRDNVDKLMDDYEKPELDQSEVSRTRATTTKKTRASITTCSQPRASCARHGARKG